MPTGKREAYEGAGMTTAIISLISHIAAWSSLAGIAFTDQFEIFANGSMYPKYVAFAISILGSLTTFHTGVAYFRNRPDRCKTDDEITKKMEKFVKTGRRLCIVSRNMSWAKDSNVNSLIQEKIDSGDMEIFVEKDGIPLDLSKNSENVRFYGSEGFVPECRFTIQNYGSKDAILRIAHLENDIHSIYRYTAADGPPFYLALDMVEVLKRYATT